jgi:hypothetical protein
MVLTAQQPYYLPNYIFLKKIHKSDIFLFADNLFYRKQSFTNRAIVKKEDKKEILIIPITKSFRGLNRIMDITIDNHSSWRSKHLKTLEYLFKFAPYFDFYFESFAELYAQIPEKLADFLWVILNWHVQTFFHEKQVYRSSEVGINTTADLKLWARREGVTTFGYFENEENYYQQNFGEEFELGKLQVKKLDKSVSTKYSPEMAIISLLFHLGPEAKSIFKDTKQNY